MSRCSPAGGEPAPHTCAFYRQALMALQAAQVPYDGADIVHLLHACSVQLNWHRLLERFRAHWRVLLNYLVLFGLVYPAKQSYIPTWVMQDLLDRLQHEVHHPPPGDQICQGTLLSRAQYLIDIECWGYRDAWLRPTGLMTAVDIAHWTAAIAEQERAL